jgi:hypothetical protein
MESCDQDGEHPPSSPGEGRRIGPDHYRHGDDVDVEDGDQGRDQAQARVGIVVGFGSSGHGVRGRTRGRTSRRGTVVPSAGIVRDPHRSEELLSIPPGEDVRGVLRTAPRVGVGEGGRVRLTDGVGEVVEVIWVVAGHAVS